MMMILYINQSILKRDLQILHESGFRQYQIENDNDDKDDYSQGLL